MLLALGANLGDPAAQIEAALEGLAAHLQLGVVSSVYRTAPVGRLDQPDFLNLVVAGTTESTVYRLHGWIQQIEGEMGRVRGEPNAPRLIDIDLLAYGELVLSSADLVVPHPRLHERSFVLDPLVEIAPEWRHPLIGRSARELATSLRNPSRVERLGVLGR
ncbi:MAG TPA: 2-amino-4-hydroxy-6-hydroxymethyldihydropteridine diphosphokinase [Longimicrobiaceae bacterium]|nr:2-amino-4-hydroxy-6-hydroxymethyldihydropteridine diphosphokinase [Longimicrobiaceae bacterium]